ncbi:MAG: small multi-drug export protein [Candidatus Sungbacteria bacterium]|nr:small multi-drug export protein [Candidatus Sungbacteria bacterium]
MPDIFTKELGTVLVAAAPLSELRGAIPLATAVFGFTPLKAFALSVIGNFLPVLPIILGLEAVANFLGRRVSFFDRFFNRLFRHTRERHTRHFELWGPLALFMFVAIPMPLTGAWSGAVAAFIFGIPFWRAVISITLGIVAAGIIVTFATLTGFLIFS